MKKLKSIGLSFENCEYLDIPAEYIDDYVIDKIYHSILSNCEFDCCGAFSLTIHAAANEIDWRTGNPNWWGSLSLFERLAYRDLVSATLTYEDGFQQEIYLPWKENDQEVNTYHHTILPTLCHHLTIVIGPDDFVRRRMGLSEERDQYDHSQS